LAETSGVTNRLTLEQIIIQRALPTRHPGQTATAWEAVFGDRWFVLFCFGTHNSRDPVRSAGVLLDGAWLREVAGTNPPSAAPNPGRGSEKPVAEPLPARDLRGGRFEVDRGIPFEAVYEVSAVDWRPGHDRFPLELNSQVRVLTNLHQTLFGSIPLLLESVRIHRYAAVAASQVPGEERQPITLGWLVVFEHSGSTVTESWPFCPIQTWVLLDGTVVAVHFRVGASVGKLATESDPGDEAGHLGRVDVPAIYGTALEAFAKLDGTVPTTFPDIYIFPVRERYVSVHWHGLGRPGVVVDLDRDGHVVELRKGVSH
jgi:hypothetical protein